MKDKDMRQRHGETLCRVLHRVDFHLVRHGVVFLIRRDARDSDNRKWPARWMVEARISLSPLGSQCRLSGFAVDGLRLVEAHLSARLRFPVTKREANVKISARDSSRLQDSRSRRFAERSASLLR